MHLVELLGVDVMNKPDEIPNISRHGEGSVETGTMGNFQLENAFCSWIFSGHLAIARVTEKIFLESWGCESTQLLWPSKRCELR